jgi:two-component system response regulator HupR/HoxA
MSTTPSSGSAPGAVSVLLVDDEAALLQTFQLSLKGEFEIEVAGSAREAEQKMAAKPYQVVVCDHMMPDEEGLHFLIRASERFPQTKRILITGHMNPELLAQNIAVARLSSCLLKPVKAPELAKAIRAAIEKPN